LNLRHSRFTATAKTLDSPEHGRRASAGAAERAAALRSGDARRSTAVARICATAVSGAAPSMSAHTTAAPSRAKPASDPAAGTHHQRHFSVDTTHRDPSDCSGLGPVSAPAPGVPMLTPRADKARAQTLPGGGAPS